MPGAIESRDLMRVLVCAAASRLSVHQACDQLARVPSVPTVLGNLASQFNDLDALAGHLNSLVATRLPTGLRKPGRRVAIVLVALPYHGAVDDGHHDEVCHSKAQGGTTQALCCVRAKQRMDHVFRTLLARVATLGIRIKLLLLDRGFYSVRVIHDLITGEWPFIMPAVTRGKKPTTPGGLTGPYALAAEKHSHWTTYPLKSAKGGRVALDLAVVCYNTPGQRGRHQRETLLYATWGLMHRPLRWMHATDRRRFGMESSYRQAHQARMRTSSCKPVLRLLFLSVALVLRNVWVWLHAEVMAQPNRGARHLRPQALRFARLLVWLLVEVASHSRLLRKIPVYHDVYERAQAFGIVFNY